LAPAPRPAPVPRIIDWEAEPTDLIAGQSAVLRWRVDDATDLEITPGVGRIDAKSGSVTVTPPTTTTYRLQSPSQPSLEPLGLTVPVAPALTSLAGYEKGWELQEVASVGNDRLAIALEAKGTVHHLGQVVTVPIRDLAGPTRVLATWRGGLYPGMSGTPDNRVLMFGRVYDAANGRDIGHFDGPMRRLHFSQDASIAVAYGSFVFSGESSPTPAIIVRDGKTGQMRLAAKLEQPAIDIALRPDGAQIAVAIGDAQKRSAVILDAHAGKQITALNYWPNAVAWLADGTIAIAEPNRPMAIVDPATGTGIKRLGLQAPIAVSADGTVLAGFNLPGNRVIVRRIRDGGACSIPAGPAPLALTPDGRLLVISHASGLAVYSTADGSPVSDLR